MRQGASRLRAGGPADRTPASTHGVFALGATRGAYVAFDIVRELLAKAESGLPRDRQASDVARRAALGVACAVAETALGAEITADRSLWTVEVPADVHDLVERTGLPMRGVREGLRILTEAGVVERVVARTANRLRLAEEAVATAPVLARVAWAPLRAALRAHGASVAPALAVTRAVAARTTGIHRDRVGDPVALTQQELAATTLFGRTAIVAALRSLADLGALTVEARRGTWTECRLGPAVFGGEAYRMQSSRMLSAPIDTVDDVARGADAPSLVARNTTSRMGERRSATSVGDSTPRATAGIDVARNASAGAADVAGQGRLPAPVLASGPGMSMEVGGVLVPLQPGMSVQPPPGAQLAIEIDPDGRRYLRIDAAIRVGPLP